MFSKICVLQIIAKVATLDACSVSVNAMKVKEQSWLTVNTERVRKSTVDPDFGEQLKKAVGTFDKVVSEKDDQKTDQEKELYKKKLNGAYKYLKRTLEQYKQYVTIALTYEAGVQDSKKVTIKYTFYNYTPATKDQDQIINPVETEVETKNSNWDQEFDNGVKPTLVDQDKQADVDLAELEKKNKQQGGVLTDSDDDSRLSDPSTGPGGPKSGGLKNGAKLTDSDDDSRLKWWHWVLISLGSVLVVGIQIGVIIIFCIGGSSKGNSHTGDLGEEDVLTEDDDDIDF